MFVLLASEHNSSSKACLFPAMFYNGIKVNFWVKVLTVGLQDALWLLIEDVRKLTSTPRADVYC